MDDQDLLHEYELELAMLRRSLGEFAKRHPKAAARLAISGEHSEDPQVERLIQSAALLNARSSVRIHDDYPEFTTALMEILYPEYLRPFPACSIAHFAAGATLEKLTAPIAIERGDQLKSRTGDYLFQSTYDVVLAPLEISDACYRQATSIPSSVRLPRDTTAVVSITFAALAPNARLDSSTAPKSVRVFVDGAPRTVAATIDTVLSRASKALVEADGCGTWIILDKVPVSPAGLDNDEALIERPGSEQSRFRRLLEYFAFRQKFDFVDIDLSALIQTVGPCKRVSLHLPIKDLHRDSAPALAMQSLGAANFKLFCTPIVNLFSCVAEPIVIADLPIPVYPAVPEALIAPTATVYSVDGVRLIETTSSGDTATPIAPFHSLSHHAAPQRCEVYWRAERDGRLAEILPGHDMLVSIVDAEGQPTKPPGEQVRADLTCTNGNLPASLAIGHAQGDLIYARNALVASVSMLCRPSESVAVAVRRTKLWDLLSAMSAGALSLDEAGLPALKALLVSHTVPHAPDAARHIDSIVGLSSETALEWMCVEPQPMLVRGLRVRLTIDEKAMSDCAVSVFAKVLEHVFVLYASVNNFMQLVLVSSHHGGDLVIGRPLAGEIPML